MDTSEYCDVFDTIQIYLEYLYASIEYTKKWNPVIMKSYRNLIT